MINSFYRSRAKKTLKRQTVVDNGKVWPTSRPQCVELRLNSTERAIGIYATLSYTRGNGTRRCRCRGIHIATGTRHIKRRALYQPVRPECTTAAVSLLLGLPPTEQHRVYKMNEPEKNPYRAASSITVACDLANIQKTRHALGGSSDGVGQVHRGDARPKKPWFIEARWCAYIFHNVEKPHEQT